MNSLKVNYSQIKLLACLVSMLAISAMASSDNTSPALTTQVEEPVIQETGTAASNETAADKDIISDIIVEIAQAMVTQGASTGIANSESTVGTQAISTNTTSASSIIPANIEADVITIEEFVQEAASAISNNNIQEFLEKYKIHVTAGTIGTVGALFTLNKYLEPRHKVALVAIVGLAAVGYKFLSQNNCTTVAKKSKKKQNK